MNDIHHSGNYKSIFSRIEEKGNKDVINLVLQENKSKYIRLMFGTDFQQIITNTSALTTDLEVDLQFHGFTGVGSMFALHGTFFTDFGGEQIDEFGDVYKYNPIIFTGTLGVGIKKINLNLISC